MRSNNLYFRVSVAAGLAIGVILPLAVLAQQPEKAAVGAAREQRNFCTILNSRPAGERFTDKIAVRVERLDAKRTEVAKQMSDRRSERDARLADLRTQQDANLSEVLTRLGDKFQGDAQKTAILAFQSTVRAAADVRRAAVDAANKAFRAGIDAAQAGRKAAVDAAVKQFNSDMKAAEDAAKASCASASADPTAIRDTLAAAVEKARADMRTAVQGAAKVGPDVVALNETRRAAVEKAMADWRTAVEKARVDLKAALGANADANANSNVNSNTNTNSGPSY